MAKNNSSLLDTLKELENLSQVNTQDPEDEEFEGGRVSTFCDTEEDASAEVAEDVFGNLRKTVGAADGGVDDETDVKYAGEKSSRKSLLAWSDGEDDEEDDMGDEEDDDVDEEEEEEVVGDSELSGDEVNQLEDDGSDNEFDDHAEDDSIDEEEEDDMADSTMNIDFSKLPDDLTGAIKQPNNDEDDDNDDGDSMSHFTSTMDNNIQKSKATKSQLDILDKLLESRIRLQKSLHVCNQLPQHNTMQNFRDEATPQVKDAYESAKTSLKELLNKLLSLQEKLCNTNIETSSILTTGSVISADPGDEEIPSDTEDEDEEPEKDSNEKDSEKNTLNLPSKRKHTLTVDEYSEEVVKRHKAFQSFQDSTINKWHEKTRLASSVASSKSFASFDKSVLHQIKQVLTDKERLVKRTQLSRVPLNILGKQTDADDGETGDAEANNNGDNVDMHLKNYDENIFDDGDFYHEMLKELIERKSSIDADDPVAAGRRWLELQKLRSKIKRKVDTRASKGRKVRYDVHTKLVSFMAPQNVGRMGDQARNNLFASLYGQKPTTVASL